MKQKRSDLISPVITSSRMEGENLAVDSYSGGAISYQHLNKPELSGDMQFWWRNNKVGDVLEGTFISEREGSYDATLRFVVARDYGKVSVAINGKTVIEEFNGYSPQLRATKIEVDDVVLQEGENSITITVTGKDEQSTNTFFALDYIDFKR